MTIGTSDGLSYEDEVSHLLGESNEKVAKMDEPNPTEQTIGGRVRGGEGGTGGGVDRPTYFYPNWKRDVIKNNPQKPTGNIPYKEVPEGEDPPINWEQGPGSGLPTDTKVADLDKKEPARLPKTWSPPLQPNLPNSPLGPWQPQKLGDAEINTDHDVKSGAVAGKNNNVVYIDPSIAKEFHPFLAVHEETEKHLMAGGMPYAKAHTIATLAEKHAVEGAGMDWTEYTDAVDTEVAKAEKGKASNPPPDPHVNIEDAIGHHADKAKTLEKADIKIGKEGNTVLAGDFEGMSPEQAQIRLDQLLRDKSVTKKSGYDVEGSGYSHYNSQIRKLREHLKGGRG